MNPLSRLVKIFSQTSGGLAFKNLGTRPPARQNLWPLLQWSSWSGSRKFFSK